MGRVTGLGTSCMQRYSCLSSTGCLANTGSSKSTVHRSSSLSSESSSVGRGFLQRLGTSGLLLGHLGKKGGMGHWFW